MRLAKLMTRIGFLVGVVFAIVPARTVVAEGAKTTLAPGAYELVEFGVRIQKTNADGDPWDRPASGPDPVITLRLDGEKVAECEREDKLKATCKVSEQLSFDENSILTLRVVDSDLASDDEVGNARLVSLKSGRGEGKILMDVDGQLVSAFVRVQGPPNWLTGHEPRLIGLGVGIIVALLLLLVFKDFWFRPASVKGPRESQEDAS